MESEETESEVTSSMIIELSSLKSWGKWSAKSREYLNNAKDDVNLYEIIISYGSIVIVFYNWFSLRQEELFRREFDETEKIINKYNKIIQKYKLPDEIIEAIEK